MEGNTALSHIYHSDERFTLILPLSSISTQVATREGIDRLSWVNTIGRPF